MSGNIGARDRLDFTLISSAVNETSRLESRCIYREEIFEPVMDVAPVPDLTAALTLVAAQTTSERGLVQTIVATPSRRAEGERAPPPRPGLW